MKLSTVLTADQASSYDKVIIAFSGGKDSLACLLSILDSGCPRDKIELWHHCIDGREGGSFFDWDVTESYCKAIATAFDIPIYFSWREGGFCREMTKVNTMETSRVSFETPAGLSHNTPRGSKKANTRMLFPQLSANLSVRWCSAYLKIDVGASAIVNQERFKKANLLFVTGERAEESAGRAKYSVSEPHKTTTKTRSVTQWRPVHAWTTQDVWAIIEKHGVNPHPCYINGWGRCSCATCIFGNKDQWASLGAVSPGKLYLVSKYEQEFSMFHGRAVTLRRDGKEILDFAETGTPYSAITPERSRLLNATEYNEPIFPAIWEMPAGATSDLTGPC